EQLVAPPDHYHAARAGSARDLSHRHTDRAGPEHADVVDRAQRYPVDRVDAAGVDVEHRGRLERDVVGQRVDVVGHGDVELGEAGAAVALAVAHAALRADVVVAALTLTAAAAAGGGHGLAARRRG